MPMTFNQRPPTGAMTLTVATDGSGAGSTNLTLPPGRWRIIALALTAGTLTPVVRIVRQGVDLGPAGATQWPAPADGAPGPMGEAVSGDTTLTLIVTGADASATIQVTLYIQADGPCN